MSGEYDDRVLDSFAALTPHLWVVAVLFFGVGDMVTTSVGLASQHVVEVGPLSVLLIERFGLLSMVPMKLLVFAFGYALWRLVPEPHHLGVPLGLAVFGVLVTGWNVIVLTAGWFLVGLVQGLGV